MHRPFRATLTFIVLFVSLGFAPSFAAAEDLGFAVPEGFEVTLYADDDLAHNIYTLTIDARGRVIVAGPGYVNILHDRDGDGRADDATQYADVPTSGAQGMYFDGSDLIFTGDESLGRLRDADGDDRADGPPEVWTRLGQSEHGAHAVLLGPDGWFYVMCGNNAGVGAEHAALPHSPVARPTSGAVLRVARDGSAMDVYAHGFRNPYDLAFNEAGQLFTIDSDGERVHHLPWYTPTRLFDVAQGQHHGWLEQGWDLSWSRPESYFDNVERVVEIGRGSPTGMVAYRHRQFPPRYRAGLFSACWTTGRAYFFPLEPNAASYAGRIETFMHTTGDVGFAPVDLDVGPEGDLFVAIGGRQTRGGVFRVRYRPGAGAIDVGDDPDAMQAVLAADQPLSSWSRARWVPRANQLGRAAFLKAAADATRSTDHRIRAVEIITECFGGLNADEAQHVVFDSDAALVARVAWSLARSDASPGSAEMLATLTSDPDSRVTRAAWEGLATVGPLTSGAIERAAWQTAATSDVRRVRAAMINVARGVAPELFALVWRSAGADANSREVLARLWIEEAPRENGPTDPQQYVDACLSACRTADSTAVRLEAVRLLQIALGDVQTQRGAAGPGYSGRDPDRIAPPLRRRVATELAPAFPSGDAELDRELARLLAMLAADDPRLPQRIAVQWNDTSRVEDDVHYLLVAARLTAARSERVTAQTARALLGLDAKLTAAGAHPSRTWPARLGEAFDNLVRHDPRLPAAIIADDDFGRPGHCLFAARMPEAQQQAAARKLLAAADEWTADGAAIPAELVLVAASLPAEEALPALRSLWQHVSLRDAIVPHLAVPPEEIDRGRLVAALDSLQPEVVAASAAALWQLNANATAGEIAAAVTALRRYCGSYGTSTSATKLRRRLRPVRQSLTALLTRWSGEPFDVGESDDGALLAAYQPCFDWFAASYPNAAQPGVADGSTFDSWHDRLTAIDWPQGDAQRGRVAFERFTCHGCHGGVEHLGPDLDGAADRFSRLDLLTAIVDPSRDVSPQYQTALVATTSGQTYYGIVVYESPEGTLLQTGATTTVRILADEFAAIEPSRVSLMPSGLLDQASDEDIADLYAYLKSLKAP